TTSTRWSKPIRSSATRATAESCTATDESSTRTTSPHSRPTTAPAYALLTASACLAGRHTFPATFNEATSRHVGRRVIARNTGRSTATTTITATATAMTATDKRSAANHRENHMYRRIAIGLLASL